MTTMLTILFMEYWLRIGEITRVLRTRFDISILKLLVKKVKAGERFEIQIDSNWIFVWNKLNIGECVLLFRFQLARVRPVDKSVS